jgi:hypothetical protein
VSKNIKRILRMDDEGKEATKVRTKLDKEAFEF